MVPAAEPPIGSIIMFTIVYPTGPAEYSYAALRVGNGLWYMTGVSGGSGLTWKNFTDSFGSMIKGPIHIVTEKKVLSP